MKFDINMRSMLDGSANIATRSSQPTPEHGIAAKAKPAGSAHDSRANNFDLIRLLLAVLVIYSHSFVLSGGINSIDGLSRMTNRQISGGDLAVDGFFIISGFLVTSSLIRSKSIWSYLKKRILRIYPGFICATLLTFVLVMSFSSGSLYGWGTMGKLVKSVWRTVSLTDLRYVGVFMSNPYPGVVNVSLWTIRLEFLCYLGLGLLGISGILRQRRICLLLFLISLVFSLAVSNSGLMSYYGDGVNTDRAGLLPFLTRLLPAYLAGVLVYLYFDRFVISTWLIISALIATVISLFIPHGILITVPICGSYILFVLAFNRSIRLNHFARHGDFSYGTYLYAFPIQQLLVSRLGGSINWWALCLLSIPASIAIAAMSWHFVEKRFLPRSRVVLTAA